MSFYANTDLSINGGAITKFMPATKSEAIALQNSGRDIAFGDLSTFIDLDPMKNMLELESQWNKQDITRQSLWQDCIKNDAVLEVNGQEGEWRSKMSVETETHMKTVDSTADQGVDGAVGGDGAPFAIILNRKLAPNVQLSCDMAFGSNLIVSDIYDIEELGYGYKHWVTLAASHKDPDRTYDATLLESNRQYNIVSNAGIAEFSEKLLGVQFPGGTNYIENKFRLGSGQGIETSFTGKADSVNLAPGYTTVDTEAYRKAILNQGLDNDNDVMIGVTQTGNTNKFHIGSILESMAISQFALNFNTSLMFMEAATISSTKGVLTFNEGLWRQMRRGFIHTYSRRGQFAYSDLKIIRDYVFQNNTGMRIEESVLRMKMGSELYDNVDLLTQKEGFRQIQNMAYLLGSSMVTSSKIVTGQNDALEVGLVKFKTVHVPGIGKFEAILDQTMDYITADRQISGNNRNGKSHTTYSGIIWDVTDQSYSNNGKLPEGTKAIKEGKRANIYLVRPENNAVFWGRSTGRYSQFSNKNILSSRKTMDEEFFMYGFGTMWMADSSKFAMTELEKPQRLQHVA